MVTITIEETDKDRQLLGRHVASAPIDKNDAKGMAALLARSFGALMYNTEVRAEIPLLIAAAWTHRASSCTRAIGYAAGLATGEYSYELAIKPVIEIDCLLDHRASKRDRETAAQMLKVMGASIRRREDND
jgi:hypothetical protein